MLAIERSAQYKRHRPETTLLYQLVERYYPEFTANIAEQGKYLPKYVEREFDEYLRCGRLEYGFMRVVCGDCKHEKLVAFSCKCRGLPDLVVVLEEWRKVPLCWSMTCYTAFQFANGY